MIVLVFIAFISLGLPDSLLGVAWPGMVATHQLSLDAMAPLLFFSTAGYVIASLLSAPLTRLLGTGGLLAASCLATAVAVLVFAVSPWWWLVVAISLVGGLGAGAIDSSLNTYVAQRHDERTMQWLHACFGIGVTTGPIIMTVAIAGTGEWRNGYLVVFVAQAILALMFFASRDRWPAIDSGTTTGTSAVPILTTAASPAAMLGVLLFLVYTGVELGMGLWIFTLLTESREIAAQTSGLVTAAYWGMFTLGRIVAGLVTHRIGNRTLVYGSLLAALLGVMLVMVDADIAVTIFGVMLTGFAVAPIFPALTSETVNRVGRAHEANAIGMQMAAASVGGALLPSAAGWLAARYGLEVIPLFLVAALMLLIAGHFVAGLRVSGGHRSA